VEVRRLVWRENNLEKLAAHGISQREVQEVIDVDAWVPATHPDYPGQVRMIGPTQRGRWLTIVLDSTDEPDRWRPVTGWDTTDQERQYHLEEYR
jgi:hypothetical protein